MYDEVRNIIRGDMITEKVVNPAIELLVKLSKARDDGMRQLALSRDAKMKYSVPERQAADSKKLRESAERSNVKRLGPSLGVEEIIEVETEIEVLDDGE